MEGPIHHRKKKFVMDIKSHNKLIKKIYHCEREK